MARLIKTEKEVEGNYSETWVVVEEDALDQWPAGPLTTVGREATRVDGAERAGGEALYTADLTFPGMLHAAVLRSPSIVVTSRPSTVWTSVMHESIGTPSIRTVHAPQ